MIGLLLDVLAPPRCAGCDARLARDAAFCAACVATLLDPPELPDGFTAAFAYGGALADAIRSTKYGERVDRLRALRRAIVVRLPPADAIDVVAPVPLHRARLIERGFDQSAILAREVARALGREVEVDLVRRVVDTPQLAKLDARGRKQVVRGAFVARALRGERVLLVDDVRTTGATIDAAAEAVRAAGGRASAHVLAATPKG